MTVVPRQRRAEEKRTQVLEATLRLIARQGAGAVTLRAVAAEAGTSLRATTYYFASREELLTAAFVYYTERAIARFRAISDQVTPQASLTRDDAALFLADTVLADLVGDRPGLVAEYELVLEIGRNPALEVSYRDWQAVLEGMLEEHARALGSTRPKVHARVVLATLRGIELEALARPSEAPSREGIATLFRELLAVLEPE